MKCFFQILFLTYVIYSNDWIQILIVKIIEFYVISKFPVLFVLDRIASEETQNYYKVFLKKSHFKIQTHLSN